MGLAFEWRQIDSRQKRVINLSQFKMNDGRNNKAKTGGKLQEWELGSCGCCDQGGRSCWCNLNKYLNKMRGSTIVSGGE